MKINSKNGIPKSKHQNSNNYQITILKTQPILDELRKLLNDEFKTVQIEAATNIIKSGKTDSFKTIVKCMEHDDVMVQLFATRAFEKI